MSAVKRLIMINSVQNKSFCFQNICMCTVYIYHEYMNTNTQHFFWKYLHEIKCIYLYHIIDIIYKYI